MKTQWNFQDKTVLITGGAQGIGRCLTLRYAQAGARVVFADIHEAAGAETVALLAAHGLTATFVAADVSSEVNVQALVSAATACDPQGALHVLINNAAIARADAAHVFSADLTGFDQVLAVNLRGPFLVSRLAVPALQKGKGCVINIASTRAFMSEPRTEGYAASKGGVIALTHALAISLGGLGIRVNAVSPGWIDTTEWQPGNPPPAVWRSVDHTQHPAGRIGRPDDIAAACLYLSSDDSGFVTGVNLTVDGGMTHKMIYLED